MINFLIFCLPVTKKNFFYILVIISTILAGINLFSIFNAQMGYILFGLFNIVYFGFSLNAWVKFKQTNDHTTIHQHLYGYAFAVMSVVDTFFFCFQEIQLKNASRAVTLTVKIISCVIFILLECYYVYYLLLSVEALPEKYCKQIDDNSRTDEYLEEDLTN